MTAALRVLVIGIAAVWLLGPVDAQLEANADTERDVLRVRAMVEHGIAPAGGPAVDYLPITLGPGWYLAVAPAVWAAPTHLRAIHGWHVAFVLLGLWLAWPAFVALCGPWGAAAVGITLVTSRWLTDSMVRIWHNAMLPGVSLILLGLLWRATTADPRARWRVLLAAWMTTVLALQLHVVAAAWAVVLLGITGAHAREYGHRPAPWAAAATWLVVAGLTVGYGMLAASVDATALAQLRSERLAGDSNVFELWVAAAQLMGPSGAEDPGAGWVVMALALAGLVVTGRGLRRGPSFDAWIGALAILGVGAAMVLAGLAVAPRYLGVAAPALFGLCAIGLGELLRQLRSRAGGPIACAIAVGAAGLGVAPSLEAADPLSGPMTVREQQASVDLLVARGLDLRAMGRRAHGALLGPLEATRAIALGAAPGPQNDEAVRVWIAPDGFPAPDGETRTVDGGSGRMLREVRFTSRFSAGDVRSEVAGRRCPIGVPWRWSHLTSVELRPFGVLPSPNLQRCRMRAPDAPLRIDLGDVSGGSPLIVVAQWFDVAGRGARGARLEAEVGGVAVEARRIDGTGAHRAVWRVPVGDGGRTVLMLGPLDRLASLDVY